MKVLSCVIFLAVLVVGTFAQMFTEYYDILGLKSDCNEKQIKKAFRKLSLKYHPDKNQGDEEAKVMFQKISEAYEVISDPEKRGIYDVDGPKGLEKLAKGGNQPASPFDMFFGGGGGGKQKGQDAHVDIQVCVCV
jgi:DnaJ-class molecular chaperone